MNTKIIHTFDEKIKVSIPRSTAICYLPDAIFYVPHELNVGRWKARFIVATAYLYALAQESEVVEVTWREMQKVLETRSFDTIDKFIKFHNNFFFETLKILKYEEDPEFPELEEKFCKLIETPSRKTQFYVVNKDLLTRLFEHKAPHRGSFYFPSVALLLPLSAQTKAIYLYLCRKARGTGGKAIAEVTTRELAGVLSLAKRTIKSSIEELVESKLIERLEGKKFKARICKFKEWNKEILKEACKIWGNHKFLTCSDREPKSAPIGNQKSPDAPIGNQTCSDREPKSAPIGNQKSPPSLLLDINKGHKKDITSSYIRDDDSLRPKNSSSEKKESSGNEKEKRETRPKKEVLISEKKGGRGAEKVARAVNSLALPEYVLSRAGARADGDALKVLSKYYDAETAKSLLAMFFYLWDRGMYRNVRNPVGFLVSLASESGADLSEFIERFTRVVPEAAAFKKRSTGESLLEAFRRKMKERLKPALYRTWVEKGVLDVVREADESVLICRDEIFAEYLKRYLRPQIEEALGKFKVRVSH